MIEFEFTIIYIYAAIIGLCVGSFINVVITRLPEKGKFLSKTRSECPSCNKTIKPYDLIPVISWVILFGKCRFCKARIPLRYPAVELLGAISSIASLLKYRFYYYTDSTVISFEHEQYIHVHHFDFNFAAVILFGVFMILLAVSIIDFNTSEIPDSLVIALIPFAIAAIWLLPDITLLSHIIGIFTVSVPMLLLSLVIPGAFGGGDIKLMFVCGFLLGWQLTLLAFFVALLLGGSTALFLLATKRRKKGQHMVFGPSLCAGVVTSLFLGNYILDWYLGFLIL